jgi:hypothetical protein
MRGSIYNELRLRSEEKMHDSIKALECWEDLRYKKRQPLIDFKRQSGRKETDRYHQTEEYKNNKRDWERHAFLDRLLHPSD